MEPIPYPPCVGPGCPHPPPRAARVTSTLFPPPPAAPAPPFLPPSPPRPPNTPSRPQPPSPPNTHRVCHAWVQAAPRHVVDHVGPRGHRLSGHLRVEGVHRDGHTAQLGGRAEGPGG